MMTKKDYIKFANMMGFLYDVAESGDEVEVLDKVTDHMVIVFRGDNPRFDEQRFRAAVSAYENKSY